MGFIPYGVISKPQGLKGKVRLVAYSGDYSNLQFISSLYILEKGTDNYIEYEIEDSYSVKKHSVIKLTGIDTIEQAEELRGEEVFVDAGQLAELSDEEYYYFELAGMEVFDTDGNLLGTVIRLDDSGPQGLLEVELAEEKLALIPFVEPILKEVDIENKRIVVAPPPGLLEL